MSFSFSRALSFLFVKEYNCIVCDRELPKPGRHRICGQCYGMMEVTGQKGCLKCGRMIFSEAQYCLDCQNREQVFDRAISPFCYSGPAATLVLNLKFRGKKYLVEPMARFMTDKLLEEELVPDLVLPVPLHPNRKKERGFNQSELLGAEIANALKLPLDLTSVRRIRDTAASSSLAGGRKEREENMKDAFEVTDRSPIEGKIVLVADDVLTTGTTANEVAKVLKKAGAKRVLVLTFAATREKPPLQEGY